MLVIVVCSTQICLMLGQVKVWPKALVLSLTNDLNGVNCFVNFNYFVNIISPEIVMYLTHHLNRSQRVCYRLLSSHPIPSHHSRLQTGGFMNLWNLNDSTRAHKSFTSAKYLTSLGNAAAVITKIRDQTFHNGHTINACFKL